jgi:hypothetical protein
MQDELYVPFVIPAPAEFTRLVTEAMSDPEEIALLEQTLASLKAKGNEMCANGLRRHCDCKRKDGPCLFKGGWYNYYRLVALKVHASFEKGKRIYRDASSYEMKHWPQQAGSEGGINGYSTNGEFIVYMASRGFEFKPQSKGPNVYFKMKDPWMTEAAKRKRARQKQEEGAPEWFDEEFR